MAGDDDWYHPRDRTGCLCPLCCLPTATSNVRCPIDPTPPSTVSSLPPHLQRSLLSLPLALAAALARFRSEQEVYRRGIISSTHTEAYDVPGQAWMATAKGAAVAARPFPTVVR